jgi:hypothetical protein
MDLILRRVHPAKRIVAKACYQMIVNHTGSLQQRITDSGAYE